MERLGLSQRRQSYPDDSDAPTATCHLQSRAEDPALCGFPFEGLIAVPTNPEWTHLHPDLRCHECSVSIGIAKERPDGRTYRFAL